MRKNLIYLSILLLQFQVYPQLKNYNGDGDVKIVSDKTVLTITHVNKAVAANFAAAAAALVPPVIDMVTKIVAYKAKKETLAYSGTYKAFSSGDNFFGTGANINLPKLELKREILIKGTTTPIPAVEIELIPEPSIDGTAFRYRLTKCTYNYSIAKTKGDYDYIDLNLEIRLKNTFIDKDQFKVNDLRTTTLNISMIHVGVGSSATGLYTGWIPMPTKSSVHDPKGKKEESKTTIKTASGTTVTTDEKTISTSSDGLYYNVIDSNTGLYEIEVIATETNPYKIKSENISEVVNTTSNTSVTLLKEILKQLTQEK